MCGYFQHEHASPATSISPVSSDTVRAVLEKEKAAASRNPGKVRTYRPPCWCAKEVCEGAQNGIGAKIGFKKISVVGGEIRMVV